MMYVSNEECRERKINQNKSNKFYLSSNESNFITNGSKIYDWKLSN